jgi:hypothetical protein
LSCRKSKGKIQVRGRHYNAFWKIITAITTTIVAAATNFYIGQIWVREGLYADKYGDADPIKPHELIIFTISGLIAAIVPAYTAAWVANAPRRSEDPEEPEVKFSTWMAIRAGKNPPLTAAVLTGCVALAILVYGPGFLTSFFD